MADGKEEGAGDTDRGIGATPSDGDARLGTLIDKYAIVRLLGRGGMGAVYEARHVRLARRFAIKFLLPDVAANQEILRRFENEAKAAGGLEHPNVAAVTDFGQAADGAPYLVMEFLEGEDCGRLLGRTGPLAVGRAADLIIQACRGLAAAHKAGIVHRDIKPENLFVTAAADGRDVVKVLDFGIAKLQLADASVATGTGATFGTAYYMSPEQARGAGDVDARADVWSLGVVLYELLGGRRPFEGEQFLHVIHQILSATAPPLAELRPDLPSRLVAIVDKAMTKDVAARLPSVAALAEALAPFARPERASGMRPSDAVKQTLATPATRIGEGAPRSEDATAPPPARRARSRAAWILGGALAIAAIGGGIVASRASRRDPERASAAPPGSTGQAAAASPPAIAPPDRALPAAPVAPIPRPPAPTTLPAPSEAASSVRTPSEQSEHAFGKRRAGGAASRKMAAPVPATAESAPKPHPPAAAPPSGRAIDIEKDNPYGP